MTELTASRAATPWHLWVVGVVTLLFNAMGIISYLSTKLGKLEEMGMTPEQIAFMQAYPAWASAFWALGVWGAFAGSVLVLLRSNWAVAAMAVGLVGLIGVTIAEQLRDNLEHAAWYARRIGEIHRYMGHLSAADIKARQYRHDRYRYAQINELIPDLTVAEIRQNFEDVFGEPLEVPIGQETGG